MSTERKARKSVTFDPEQTIVTEEGDITMASTPNETKETAESHSLAPAEAPVDGGDEIDLSLLKKKKKAKKEAAVEEAAADEDGVDLSLLKKKKKKKAPKDVDDDFAAQVKALAIEDAAAEAPAEEEQSGDMELGTGIWEHDETRPIAYNMLLSRFFHQLSEKNPDHALSGSKSYKIPPPQCMREGNKKTIFANIADICKRMKRSDEHVTAYLFAELGTTGSTDGSRRLVIKGRFQQKQIENVLRKYIIEYLTCKTCKSPDTELNKGENRLFFITCNSCGSRRSVAAIKTGFSAQVGKRKKMRA